MKSAYPTRPRPICVVQSITYTPERRIITFTNAAPKPAAGPVAIKRRKPPVHLKLVLAPAAVFSFEPVIHFASSAKS